MRVDSNFTYHFWKAVANQGGHQLVRFNIQNDRGTAVYRGGQGEYLGLHPGKQ